MLYNVNEQPICENGGALLNLQTAVTFLLVLFEVIKWKGRSVTENVFTFYVHLQNYPSRAMSHTLALTKSLKIVSTTKAPTNVRSTDYKESKLASVIMVSD